MPANIGALDRALRVIVGLALVSLAFWGPETPWGLVGLVPLATAFAGFCPAYRLLGVCTLKKT